MTTLNLRGDHITLAHALKAAGLTASGGEAKSIVRDGLVLVNGTVETKPGRKLTAGDRFQVAESDAWTVAAADEP